MSATYEPQNAFEIAVFEKFRSLETRMANCHAAAVAAVNATFALHRLIEDLRRRSEPNGESHDAPDEAEPEPHPSDSRPPDAE